MSANNITAQPQTSKARQQNTRYQKPLDNAKKQFPHNASTTSDEEINAVISTLDDPHRKDSQFVTQGGV